MEERDHTSRVVLAALTVAALMALGGLAALAGIAGFGFGVVLLICGAIGDACGDDIARQKDEAANH